MLFGLVNGRYDSSSRLKVTSRKFEHFLLISVVTLSPNPWNTFVISLALWLASVSDWFLNTAKPSSL